MLKCTGAGGAVARTCMGERLFGRNAVLRSLRNGAMLCVNCNNALVRCTLYALYSEHFLLATAP